MSPGRLLLALLAAVCPVAADYGSRALERANAGAPNSEVLTLFRAAIFLDESTSPQSWSNLGVALLHQAGASQGAVAEGHGLWSLIVLELTLRMDPLRLAGASMVEQNIGLLREKCPSVGPIIDRESRRAFWRGNLLLTSPTYGEKGLALAQEGRESESIPFLWVDLLESEKESAAPWLNLAVAMNKARGRAVSQKARFAELSAVALAAFDRAIELYRADGTPLGPDGLPPPIRDNQGVIDHLRQVAAEDPERAKHAARARGIIANRSNWPELKTDRWRLRRSLTKPAAASLGGLERVYRVAGLFSDGLMFARVHSWRSPQLKSSALTLLRSAAEESGLMPALEAAAALEDAEAEARGRARASSRAPPPGSPAGSTEAVRAALQGLADSRLVDPMLTLSLGFVCLAVAADAEAALDAPRAQAVRREALGAFRLSLEVCPPPPVGRDGG